MEKTLEQKYEELQKEFDEVVKINFRLIEMCEEALKSDKAMKELEQAMEDLTK